MLGRLGSHYGRKGVLLASIRMAARLRQESTKNYIEFNNLYIQLKRIAQLCECSDNNKGIKKKLGVGPNTKVNREIAAYSSTLSAEVRLKVHDKTFTVTLERSTMTGSPIDDDNDTSIELRLSLPMEVNNEDIVDFVKKLKELISVSPADVTEPVKDLMNVLHSFNELSTIQSFLGFLDELPVEIGASVCRSEELVYVWNKVDAVNTKPMVALPGLLLIEDNGKSRYVLHHASIAENREVKVAMGADIGDAGMEVEGSHSKGRVVEITGTNTLNYLTSGFSTLMLGRVDSKSEAAALATEFLKDQKGQLENIFCRIGQGDTNAALELQALYNELLTTNAKKHLKNEEVKMSEVIKDVKQLTDELSRFPGFKYDAESIQGVVGKAEAALQQAMRAFSIEELDEIKRVIKNEMKALYKKPKVGVEDSLHVLGGHSAMVCLSDENKKKAHEQLKKAREQAKKASKIVLAVVEKMKAHVKEQSEIKITFAKFVDACKKIHEKDIDARVLSPIIEQTETQVEVTNPVAEFGPENETTARKAVEGNPNKSSESVVSRQRSVLDSTPIRLRRHVLRQSSMSSFSVKRDRMIEFNSREEIDYYDIAFRSLQKN